MIISIFILAIAGFLVSMYAIYIERKHAVDTEFKPVCEINDRMSCVRALSSTYSKLFGIPLAVYGLFFYATLAACAFFNVTNLVFLMAIAGLIATIIFAYLLFFKIKTFCFVCTTTYAINIAIFFVALFSKGV